MGNGEDGERIERQGDGKGKKLWGRIDMLALNSVLPSPSASRGLALHGFHHSIRCACINAGDSIKYIMENTYGTHNQSLSTITTANTCHNHRSCIYMLCSLTFVGQGEA